MQSFESKYGIIKGITHTSFHQNGTIRECTVNEHNELKTSHGVLIPQFEDCGFRKKLTNSMTFYKCGSLKSICLQEQTKVGTTIGQFSAELLTFYESGSIKRLFPLNGKLSAYWTEEDEYQLTEECFFDLPEISFHSRIIGIYFYESGKVKSITLWPNEVVKVRCLTGIIPVRTGISFYPDGKIKSVEPDGLLHVKTPIGEVAVFNSSLIGINGDNNSLNFYPDGTIKSLLTSTDIIAAIDKNGKKVYHSPGIQPSLLEEDKQSVIPMKIDFYNGFCRFNESNAEYEINQYEFSVRHYPRYLALGSCSDCSQCNLCG